MAASTAGLSMPRAASCCTMRARAAASSACSVIPGTGPAPVEDFGQILAVFANVVVVLVQQALHFPAQVIGLGAEPQVAEGIQHQVIAAQAIAHSHVKGGGGGALFAVAPRMEVGGVGPAGGQAVAGPGIAVAGKEHR